MKRPFPSRRLVLTVVSIVLAVVSRAGAVVAAAEGALAADGSSPSSAAKEGRREASSPDAKTGRPESPSAAEAQLQKQVQALIALFDADTLAARTRAENELLKLGPKILPHLPPPELIEPAARRDAVRRLRNVLEREQARLSVQPSRITLAGAHKLADLLSTVAAQSGNKLDISRLSATQRDQSVAAEYRDMTFWDVLDDLRVKYGLEFAAAEGTLILSTREKTSQAADGRVIAHSGAFRLAVKPAQLRPLVGDEQHRLVRVQGTVLAEPRLRPLFLKYAAGDWRARTRPEAAIAVFDPQAVIELPFGTFGQETAFQVDFKLAASAPIEKVICGGQLSVLTAAGAEEFVFSRLAGKEAQGVSRRKGGVTVTLQSVEWLPADQGKATARIRIAVAYDSGGPAFESHRTWVFHNLSRLEKSDGKRFDRRDAFTTTRQADGVVAVEYLFENLEGPAENFWFIYTAPTLVIQAPVRFDGMEIPLINPAPERKAQ